MDDLQESILIPRERVFVLLDGTFVVQWEENQVQHLLSGKYSPYTDAQFGAAVTDYELNQLIKAGVVIKYTARQIYLFPSPNITPKRPGRSYYLNTTHAKDEIHIVQNALEAEMLLDRFSVRLRDDFVVIWGKDGVAFHRFEDAEKARDLLMERIPGLLRETVIAFVEIISLP